jgi:hypothetical protein
MKPFNDEKMQDRFESVNNEALEAIFSEVDLEIYNEEIERL